MYTQQVKNDKTGKSETIIDKGARERIATAKFERALKDGNLHTIANITHAQKRLENEIF